MSKSANQVPARGDIVKANLNHEMSFQAMTYVVLSPIQFNAYGSILVMPILHADKAKDYEGFHLPIKLEGDYVILCHKPQSIDTKTHEITIIDKAQKGLVEDALARARTLLD